MLEENFVYVMIKDILSTEKYTITDIAQCTGIIEDVLFEVISGYHTHPSLDCFKKVSKLHKLVRETLYYNLLKKILLKQAHPLLPR